MEKTPIDCKERDLQTHTCAPARELRRPCVRRKALMTTTKTPSPLTDRRLRWHRERGLKARSA